MALAFSYGAGFMWVVGRGARKRCGCAGQGRSAGRGRARADVQVWDRRSGGLVCGAN